MVMLAWIVWRFVERPGQRLFKRALVRDPIALQPRGLSASPSSALNRLKAQQTPSKNF
jgi:peptidoglycan/LPS O-acetylase OafA/YrhL